MMAAKIIDFSDLNDIPTATSRQGSDLGQAKTRTDIFEQSPTSSNYDALIGIIEQLKENKVSFESTVEDCGNQAQSNYIDVGNGKSERKDDCDMSPQDEKYIEQRFVNIEDKLDHRTELVSQKIDSLAKAINENSEWMKVLVESTKDEIKEIKNDGKSTRSTVIMTTIGAVVTLFVGLGSIVFAISQMQESWLQEYIRILSEAFLSSATGK